MVGADSVNGMGGKGMGALRLNRLIVDSGWVLLAEGSRAESIASCVFKLLVVVDCLIFRTTRLVTKNEHKRQCVGGPHLEHI